MLQGPHLVVNPNCHREWGRQRTDISESADDAAGSEKYHLPSGWGKVVQNLSPNQENSVNTLSQLHTRICLQIHVMPGLQGMKQYLSISTHSLGVPPAPRWAVVLVYGDWVPVRRFSVTLDDHRCKKAVSQHVLYSLFVEIFLGKNTRNKILCPGHSIHSG